VNNERRNFWTCGLLTLTALYVSACASSGGSAPAPSASTEEASMAETAPIHHTINYIEFTVTEMAACKRFYGAAFDWQFNDYGPDYAGIRKEGGEAGGLRLDSSVSPGGPLVILYSRNLDETLARVRKAGGKIVKEPFTFPGGRRFHFQDPSGNELAVWSER